MRFRDRDTFQGLRPQRPCVRYFGGPRVVLMSCPPFVRSCLMGRTMPDRLSVCQHANLGLCPLRG